MNIPELINRLETLSTAELAAEYDGQLKVCKVDVDANPDVPGKFGIRGIPTLIVFKGGNAEATKVGENQLPAFIQHADRRTIQFWLSRVFNVSGSFIQIETFDYATVKIPQLIR